MGRRRNYRQLTSDEWDFLTDHFRNLATALQDDFKKTVRSLGPDWEGQILFDKPDKSSPHLLVRFIRRPDKKGPRDSTALAGPIGGQLYREFAAVISDTEANQVADLILDFAGDHNLVPHLDREHSITQWDGEDRVRGFISYILRPQYFAQYFTDFVEQISE